MINETSVEEAGQIDKISLVNAELFKINDQIATLEDNLKLIIENSPQTEKNIDAKVCATPLLQELNAIVNRLLALNNKIRV